MLGAGQRNKKIWLQIPTVTRDNDGSETITYTDLIEVWAQIKPMAGKSFWLSNQVVSDMTHEITILYRNIDVRWAVRYGNRIFSIMDIKNPMETNRELVLLCKEVIA